ncbi:MAG: PEP-CTERM sorting domain-containing protein [Planctomyces sp.]
MRFFIRILIGFAAICPGSMIATVCRGDLIIQVHDAQIAYGGSGFVDVTVSGGAADDLSAFSAQMKITTAATLNGGVEFVSPFFDPSAVTSPIPYVFLGDSDGYNVAYVTADEINVGDATDSGNSVSLNSTFLLMRLLVKHTGGFGAVGETFQIEFLDLHGGTALLDGAGLPSPFNPASDFAGTITIVTPEPAFGGLLALGSIGGLVWRRRRARLKS